MPHLVLIVLVNNISVTVTCTITSLHAPIMFVHASLLSLEFPSTDKNRVLQLKRRCSNGYTRHLQHDLYKPENNTSYIMREQEVIQCSMKHIFHHDAVVTKLKYYCKQRHNVDVG